MSDWTKTHPKQVSKNDLVGMKLSILRDCPPEASNRKGMMNLKVFSVEDSKTYIVLVTGQDLNTIIDNPDHFSFKKKEGQEWAEVEPL